MKSLPLRSPSLVEPRTGATAAAHMPPSETTLRLLPSPASLRVLPLPQAPALSPLQHEASPVVPAFRLHLREPQRVTACITEEHLGSR